MNKPVKLTEAVVRDAAPKATRYDLFDAKTPGLMLRVFPSGKKTWNYRYRVGKTHRRYKIGDADKVTPDAARRALAGIAGKIAQGSDPGATKRAEATAEQRQQRSTLAVFLTEHYEPWATVERRTGTATVKRIRSTFADLLTTPMGDLTSWRLEQWRKARHEKGRQPSTTNRDLTALKACLAKAVEWKVIDRHPLADLKPRKTDKEVPIRVISEAEEKALREALKKRDDTLREARTRANAWRGERGYGLFPAYGPFADHLEPVVLLALATGMRRGEILTLRTEDVKAGSVTVRGTVTKSQQSRVIPLNAEAQRVLKDWNPQGEWVFPGTDDEAALTTIKKSWMGLRKAAALPSVRFHDLRHTFATRLLQRGADIRTVSSLLGHQDIAITARYLHATDESKRRAVDLL
jgi:integrase